MDANNPYKNELDFAGLAVEDPDFAKVYVNNYFYLITIQPTISILCPCTNPPCSLKPNGQLDFTNPETVQQLTKSLLKRDFNLQIDLPPDRLCPPVSVEPLRIEASSRADWSRSQIA